MHSISGWKDWSSKEYRLFFKNLSQFSSSEHPYTKQASDFFFVFFFFFYSLLCTTGSVVCTVHILSFADMKQNIRCLCFQCKCLRSAHFKVLGSVSCSSICLSDQMHSNGKSLPKLPNSIKSETPHTYNTISVFLLFHGLFLMFALVPQALFTVCQGVKTLDGRPGWFCSERLLTDLFNKSQALTCSLLCDMWYSLQLCCSCLYIIPLIGFYHVCLIALPDIYLFSNIPKVWSSAVLVQSAVLMLNSLNSLCNISTYHIPHVCSLVMQ